ncbi:MAG: hypothetical protein QM765_33780 [Myxococcales bacterium]
MHAAAAKEPASSAQPATAAAPSPAAQSKPVEAAAQKKEVERKDQGLHLGRAVIPSPDKLARPRGESRDVAEDPRYHLMRLLVNSLNHDGAAAPPGRPGPPAGPAIHSSSDRIEQVTSKD